MRKIILGFLAGAVFSSVLMISLPVAAGKATIQDVFDKVKATKTSVGNVDSDLAEHDDDMVNLLFYIDTNAYYACLASDYAEYCLDILASSNSVGEDTKADIQIMREETGAAQRIQEIIESK